MPKSDSREAVQGLFQRLYNEFGEESGNKIINIIIQELGGLRVSIPDFESINRIERNRKIKERFTGDNHKELAFIFNLSPHQVRRILRERN